MRDTVVLAPAGYVVDPGLGSGLGSDPERPWRLARGLGAKGLRVVVVAREVMAREELGSNVEVAYPPFRRPKTPSGRLADRLNLYWFARIVARREVNADRAFVVHHCGPCGEGSPSLIGRIAVPFVYGPVPAKRPPGKLSDEWLTWLGTAGARPRAGRASWLLNKLVEPVAHQLSRRTLRRADAITVESAEYLVANTARPVVIPPGIDAALFAPRPPNERPVPGRVIAVGQLIQRKGYDTLIRALGLAREHLPSAHLLIVGEGPEEASLRRLADTLELGHSVRFLGRKSRAELPELLRSAMVFCHPARLDFFPLAPLEAMSCGVPVLVSSWGSLPGIAGGGGLIHSAGDVSQLTDQILTILTSTERRQDLGATARERVLQLYTWDRMCDSYLNLYRSLSPGKAPIRSSSNGDVREA